MVTFGSLSFVNSNFGNVSANVLHHARKILFSLIVTQILNSGSTEHPVLLYLAEKYFQRNEFCLLFDLEKVSHTFISCKLDNCSLLYCGYQP